MTDISVKHDPATGAAVIEIRGTSLGETRFRLRDPSSDKYLTKRGWTKTASFLPAEAVAEDGVLVLTLDADLARKVPANALLSLEQPAADFREAFTWLEPVIAAVAETPAEPAPDEAVPEAGPAEPEISFGGSLLEPAIMDEHLHHDAEPPRTAERADAFADNGNDRASWAPAAIAAALFFVLGMGLSYLLFGSGDGAAVKDAQQAATIQIEKERWEFQRQLAAAKEEASSASLDKSKAADARIASLSGKADQLAAERDAARKALADNQAQMEGLERKLADASAQIEAVRNSAGDEAKAQIGVLDQKIASLTGELDKTNEELARRDQLLRDTDAQLKEANEQIAAVRDAAQKEAEALNADLTEKTDSLTAEIERTKTQLAEREQLLKEARAELAAARDGANSEAQARNAALSTEIDGLKAQIVQSRQQIAERDKALRDAQAKLSVANIQIDALKVVAGKSTEADLERTALDEKVAGLSADLDKAGKALADKDKALAEATARLKEADARLAAADSRKETPANEQVPPGGQDASDETVARLQEERDLYASELKAMTSNFTALQAEKAELQKTIASLQGDLDDANVTTSQIPSKAIWGATAIDETGTIYALQNQTGEKAAQDNVNAICRGKSKFRCEALATYSNACFSVARIEGEGPAIDNFAYFIHKDWKRSASTALEQCQRMGAACTLRFTACSPDALSKPISD